MSETTVVLNAWQLTTMIVALCAMVAAIVWVEAWVVDVREAVKKGQKLE